MTLALPRTTMARLTGALRGDLRTADTATPTPQNPESLLDFSNDFSSDGTFTGDLQQRLGVYCALRMNGCRSADPGVRQKLRNQHEHDFFSSLAKVIGERYLYGYIVIDETGLSLYENDSTRAMRTPRVRIHGITFGHGCYRAASMMMQVLTGYYHRPEMCSDKKVSFMEAHRDPEHGWSSKLGIRRPEALN